MTGSPHPLRRYGPAVAMALLIPVLSLLSPSFFRHLSGPKHVPGFDKLIHALMYAALAAALFHVLTPSARVRYSWAFRLALAATLYGVAMELCQKFLTSSRSPDPLDALANMAGALAVALLACAWSRKNAASVGAYILPPS